MPNNARFISLLPPNAQPAERALEEASATLLSDIDNPIRAVKFADTCPAALLPWLAWEFSVDTWNSDWTEQEKRNAIKRAAYIHRHRGTPAAVAMSLSDSPFASRVEEWFEQEPPGEPYTFTLHVEQDGRPIAQTDIQDLKNAVLRAKNLRSWFNVSFHGSSTGTAYVGGAMVVSETITFYPAPERLVSEDGAGFITESGDVLLTELRFE